MCGTAGGGCATSSILYQLFSRRSLAQLVNKGKAFCVPTRSAGMRGQTGLSVLGEEDNRP